MLRRAGKGSSPSPDRHRERSAIIFAAAPRRHTSDGVTDPFPPDVGDAPPTVTLRVGGVGVALSLLPSISFGSSTTHAACVACIFRKKPEGKHALDWGVSIYV